MNRLLIALVAMTGLCSGCDSKNSDDSSSSDADTSYRQAEMRQQGAQAMIDYLNRPREATPAPSYTPPTSGYRTVCDASFNCRQMWVAN